MCVCVCVCVYSKGRGKARAGSELAHTGLNLSAPDLSVEMCGCPNLLSVPGYVLWSVC